MSGSMPRRRRASGSAASTIRSPFRSARAGAAGGARRAGGVAATPCGAPPTYEDETLWNYELGVRGRRGGINFAAAAFYTDISNPQGTAYAGSCAPVGGFQL